MSFGSPYTKLSTTTRSATPPAETSLTVAPNAAEPNVMRTRATLAWANTAPMNERPAASDLVGAMSLARLLPATSKNSMELDPTTSTSLKTAPNPVTRAGDG